MQEGLKLFSINLGLYGSTGKIMYAISNLVKENGGQAIMCYPFSYANLKGEESDVILGNDISRKINTLFERTTGFLGCFGFSNTKKIIKAIEQFKPDIIHLHNVHGMPINLEKLFNFIKSLNVKVVWTLHDCWSFTGQCPYFDMANCDKWKTGCYKCKSIKNYPKTYVDRTKSMYKRKKSWFNGIKNLTLVTPSVWLKDLVKQSFLKDYPVKVINNGIDLNVFKPMDSNFRKENNLEDKKVVLGVAFDWGARKGLDVFIKLSKKLKDNYKIVLVGVDKQTAENLPENILTIERTNSQEELAKIYSMADVLVNPTREENYPTVNMEAIASGTPVITFKTGGSPEIIDKKTGVSIEKEDLDALLEEIERICETKPFCKTDLENRAKLFDKNQRFQEYLDLFNQIR